MKCLVGYAPRMATSAQRLAASPPPRTGRRRSKHLSVVDEAHGIVARDVNPDHATCRTLGHAWVHRRKPVTEDEARAPMKAYGSAGILSVCATCQAERVKWVSRSGGLMGNTYRYAEGYERRGDGRISPTAWRRVWVVSMFGENA
jgi:hypothetical protein